MAYPTPTTYSGASGAHILRGRTGFSQPAWVPALGTVADVSLNTLNDVKGVITNSISTTRSWSGVAYASWWGAYGKLVGGGGGHGDGNENFLMQYDIESRLFSILKPSCPVFHDVADNYVADVTTGWMFGDAAGGSLQVGEPFTSHFYNIQIAVPPSALAGAPNGWLLTPGRGSMAEGGQKGTNQAHKIALGSSDKWTMHGAPLVRSPSHGASIYDPKRNRVVALSESQASATQTHTYIDMATAAVGTITLGDYVTAFYAIPGYHAAADCYMLARFASSALTLVVIDATTNAVTRPTATGTPPVDTTEGAWDWVESWNAWVYYPGSGGNDIYTLKCSGDPRGNNWTWAKQTVTGVARSRFIDGNGGGTPYSRLRYVPTLDAVLWFPDYLIPAQMFRISAP